MQAGAVETLKFKMWVRSLSSDITVLHLSGLEGLLPSKYLYFRKLDKNYFYF